MQVMALQKSMAISSTPLLITLQQLAQQQQAFKQQQTHVPEPQHPNHMDDEYAIRVYSNSRKLL